MHTSQNNNSISTIISRNIPSIQLQQDQSRYGRTSEKTTAVKKSYPRKRKYKTEEERLQANRKSAAESRLRKKILLSELQNEVNMLQNENSLLQIENNIMKQKIRLSQTSGSVSTFMKNNPLLLYSTPVSLTAKSVEAISHPIHSKNNSMSCDQYKRNYIPIGLCNSRNMKQQMILRERFGVAEELLKNNMRQQARELMRLAMVQKIA